MASPYVAADTASIRHCRSSRSRETRPWREKSTAAFDCCMPGREGQRPVTPKSGENGAARQESLAPHLTGLWRPPREGTRGRPFGPALGGTGSRPPGTAGITAPGGGRREPEVPCSERRRTHLGMQSGDGQPKRNAPSVRHVTCGRSSYVPTASRCWLRTQKLTIAAASRRKRLMSAWRSNTASAPASR